VSADHHVSWGPTVLSFVIDSTELESGTGYRVFVQIADQGGERNLFHWHASDARNDEPRPSVITCKKCSGVCQRVASLPKRFENAAYEVFQCLTCEFVDWVQRD